MILISKMELFKFKVFSYQEIETCKIKAQLK